MTEALNRHLPERLRLRVPLRPRPAAVRPRCRTSLAATLKPSSLPFEALKAMSENPAMFRRFWSLLPLVILALSLSSVRAAETNASPRVPESKPTTVPAAEPTPAPAASAPAIAPTVAPPSTNGVAPTVTAPAPAPDSGQRERTRDRDRVSSSGTNGSPGAAATNAPLGSFESFRLIAERNIFDPNRTPRVSRSSGSAEEPKRMPKIEAFALAGTMSFSNRPVAFFTSANSQYQKALKPGDVIAGYQIAAVTADHVKLQREGAALELKVNQQLRREDEGPWQVSARAESVASAPASPGASGGTVSGGAPAVPAGASELLKRLMEQRAKEQ